MVPKNSAVIGTFGFGYGLWQKVEGSLASAMASAKNCALSRPQLCDIIKLEEVSSSFITTWGFAWATLFLSQGSDSILNKQPRVTLQGFIGGIYGSIELWCFRLKLETIKDIKHLHLDLFSTL